MKYLLITLLASSVLMNLFFVLVSIPHIRAELDFWKRKEEEWSRYWRAYYGEQKNEGPNFKDDQASK